MVYPALLPLMRTLRLASSRLNWHPHRFKWTRPFRRKTKCGFCACAITFQLASSTSSSLQLKRDGTRWRTGEEVKRKLANGVGSQYPSHCLGTWCIQHYYRWCAHLGWPVVDWTDIPTDLNGLVRFARKTKYCFCACVITFQIQSTKRWHAFPLFLILFSEHCRKSTRPYIRMFLAGVGETRKDSRFMGTPPRGSVLNQNRD